MANTTFDPYDPDEIKRRQLFDTEGTQSQSVMQPDEEETGIPNYAVAPGAVAPRNPTLTPAQQRYQTVLGQMPKAEDYQPSRGRRIMASIAGGLAGLKDAKTGVEIGTNIVRQPFNNAMSSWQRSIGAEASNVALDKQIQAEDIARQRAASYSESAHARTRSATATENWREYQKAHTPWAPTTKEEMLELESVKHPVHPAAERRPTTFEEYQTDPDGYRKYLEDVQAGKAVPLTFEQRRQLGAEHDARVTARMRTHTNAPATPAQQAQAEALATEHITRTNPAHEAFVVRDSKTGKVTRVKTLDELPRESSGVLGFGGVSGAQASLARDKYRQFLSDRDKEKQRILGSKTNGAATWDITQEDDDEGEEEQ